MAAIKWAATGGFFRYVRTLPKKGADVSLLWMVKVRTAPHVLSIKRHPAMTRLLFRAGANLEAADSTPLNIAAGKGYSEPMSVLIDEGRILLAARQVQPR